jgi:cytoskeletal protein RodZ
MATVSEQLREAREAKNLSVHDVAEATKIRTDHIRALDQGDYDVFPAAVYIRGFVRTYSAFLKLDVAAIITQLNIELQQSKKHHEHPPLTPKPPGVLDWVMFQLSRLNWRIVLPIVAGGGILLGAAYGYRAWATRKPQDPLSQLGPGVYQPAKPVEGETLPLPKSP